MNNSNKSRFWMWFGLVMTLLIGGMIGTYMLNIYKPEIFDNGRTIMKWFFTTDDQVKEDPDIKKEEPEEQEPKEDKEEKSSFGWIIFAIFMIIIIGILVLLLFMKNTPISRKKSLRYCRDWAKEYLKEKNVCYSGEPIDDPYDDLGAYDRVGFIFSKYPLYRDQLVDMLPDEYCVSVEMSMLDPHNEINGPFEVNRFGLRQMINDRNKGRIGEIVSPGKLRKEGFDTLFGDEQDTIKEAAAETIGQGIGQRSVQG